jgi:hypothetical protein
VTIPDDGDASDGGPDAPATEALWDELFKHNRRQQERLQRALEERRSCGEDDDEAFENALEDLGLEVPGEEPGSEDEPGLEDEQEAFAGPMSGDAVPGNADVGDGDEEDDPFRAEDDERHPLLQAAMDLLKHLHEVFRGADPRFAPSLHALFQGAGDAMGGLAQALSRPVEDLDDYGLCVTQLKRALRGAAFARGALFSLRPAVTAEQFDELLRTLGRLEKDVFQELSRLRSEHPSGDS